MAQTRYLSPKTVEVARAIQLLSNSQLAALAEILPDEDFTASGLYEELRNRFTHEAANLIGNATAAI